MLDAGCAKRGLLSLSLSSQGGEGGASGVKRRPAASSFWRGKAAGNGRQRELAHFFRL